MNLLVKAELKSKNDLIEVDNQIFSLTLMLSEDYDV